MNSVLNVLNQFKGYLFNSMDIDESKESVNLHSNNDTALKVKAVDMDKLLDSSHQCLFKSVCGDLMFIPNVDTGLVDGCEILKVTICKSKTIDGKLKFNDLEHGYKAISETEYLKILHRYNSGFIMFKVN